MSDDNDDNDDDDVCSLCSNQRRWPEYYKVIRSVYLWIMSAAP